MAEINDGGAASPLNTGSFRPEPGMSKREEYASRALAGILAGYWACPEACGWSHEALAREAVASADALIEALNPTH